MLRLLCGELLLTLTLRESSISIFTSSIPVCVNLFGVVVVVVIIALPLCKFPSSSCSSSSSSSLKDTSSSILELKGLTGSLNSQISSNSGGADSDLLCDLNDLGLVPKASSKLIIASGTPLIGDVNLESSLAKNLGLSVILGSGTRFGLMYFADGDLGGVNTV